MCILGKKYPKTPEDFARSGLPGNFERERAGKRMKLPVPETWETLLSAKGNKASTWEELIEHKKLPFMAMLRNIRNLIFAGICLCGILLNSWLTLL
jgi:telomerase protein component 1